VSEFGSPGVCVSRHGPSRRPDLGKQSIGGCRPRQGDLAQKSVVLVGKSAVDRLGLGIAASFLLLSNIALPIRPPPQDLNSAEIGACFLVGRDIGVGMAAAEHAKGFYLGLAIWTAQGRADKKPELKVCFGSQHLARRLWLGSSIFGDNELILGGSVARLYLKALLYEGQQRGVGSGMDRRERCADGWLTHWRFPPTG
jgi:hypothetical protein